MVMQLSIHTPMIRVVEVVKAIQRIPKPIRPDVTFFSENDVWLFQARQDTKVCQLCQKYETAYQWRGNNLRLEFPYLTILDQNTIGGSEPDGDGLVHPNCRCRLVRLIAPHAKV